MTKLFNHGIFQEKLQDKLNHLLELRQTETDPYAQWNLEEQSKLVTELLETYKITVSSQLND